MTRDLARTTPGQHPDEALKSFLNAAHTGIGIAVCDRLAAQGGVPELCDPDVALSRALSAAHRALGSSVSRRLVQEAGPEDEEALTEQVEGCLPPDHPLAGRLAPVRIKYRGRALQTAQSYGLKDLMSALAKARTIAEDVISLLEAEGTDTQVLVSVQQLERLFEQAMRLAGRRPPTTIRPPASDYLRAVEESLEVHARPLLYAVHGAQQLLQEELLPMIADPDSTVDSAMVTQDLADDLEKAWVKAHDLSRAVAIVQVVSNDFVGEDLRQAKLEGTLLAGVRWNAATSWPDEWEPLIRRASTPEKKEPGVLVVAAEPCDTKVSADT